MSNLFYVVQLYYYIVYSPYLFSQLQLSFALAGILISIPLIYYLHVNPIDVAMMGKEVMRRPPVQICSQHPRRFVANVGCWGLVRSSRVNDEYVR